MVAKMTDIEKDNPATTPMTNLLIDFSVKKMANIDLNIN